MNYIDNLGSVLSSSLTGVWGIFVNLVPTLLLAIVLFVVGMLIASVLGKAIAQLIEVTRVDKLLKSAGAEEFLSKMGLKLNTGKFFGVIVQWFIAIVFLMASLQIVNLSEVSQFIGEMVLLYLPKVIIIVIILMLAVIIADAVKKIVATSVKAANMKSSEVLASIAKYAVWIIAIMLIFAQFENIEKYILIIFSGIMGFIVIAGGIAFGIGGKDAASRAIEKFSKEMSSEK